MHPDITIPMTICSPAKYVQSPIPYKVWHLLDPPNRSHLG